MAALKFIALIAVIAVVAIGAVLSMGLLGSPGQTSTAQQTSMTTPTTTHTTTSTASQTSSPTTTTSSPDWTIEEGSGSFYRAVHMGGNWGTNRDAVLTLPPEYFEYLRDLNVNWVGVSVALHVDGSMDSTVELDYDQALQIPTFSEEVLRELIGTFRRHGFNVYIHIAFEGGATGEHPVDRWQLGDPLIYEENPSILPEFWPWRLDHPQHQDFVASFWQSYTDCVVHIADLAQEEGVGMLTLGTETDRLFRSRSQSPRWPNNFLNEMQAMVAAVRDVYQGQLGYEMHWQSLTKREFYGPGSDYLASDLNLDFIAVSAYFQLMPNTLPNVPSVLDLEGVWDSIFNAHLKPLKERNDGRSLVFTEFGYVDSVESLVMATADEFADKVFIDRDDDGDDDGEETQANAYEALFNTMDKYPEVLQGSFLWDVNMTTEEQYQQSFAQKRTFNIRDKLAEGLVREQYSGWIDQP